MPGTEKTALLHTSDYLNVPGAALLQIKLSPAYYAACFVR
jgi:hypothetical protein